MKQKHKNNKNRIYYPIHNLGAVAAFILFFMCIGTIHYAFIESINSYRYLIALFMALASLVLAWFAYQDFFYDKLVFWENGLEVYHYGRHMLIFWEDLDHLGWYRGQKDWGLYYIRTERKAEGFVGSIIGKPAFIALQHYIGLPTSIKPRSDAAAEHYMQSPLVQDLLRHAPHLLEDEMTKYEKRKAIRQQRAENKQKVDHWHREDEQEESHEQL